MPTRVRLCCGHRGRVLFEPGTQLGRYEIQRRLGRGGMGTVYVAHDPVLGRMVAIKVFAGDLDMPDARERFSREARASAALNHPNIVTVYDFGEYGSQPYIVMEYVPGETLANIIRRKAAVDARALFGRRLCASDVGDPSRHQAGEPDDRSRGPLEDSRLRHRADAGH